MMTPMAAKLVFGGAVVGAAVLAEAAVSTAPPYIEWTALAAICFVVVWLITKTLPKVTESQQRTIDSLVQQTSALRDTLARLTEVVTNVSTRQDKLTDVVEANQKLHELTMRQTETLQLVVTEIMRTMVDARDMMRPVPKLREEQNVLLREMLVVLQKTGDST